MNIKQFMMLVKEKFITDNVRLSNSRGIYTNGLCCAIQDALESCGTVFDDYSTYAESENRKIANTLLRKYKPANAKMYWWPIYKKECTQGEAITPRLAVLDAIIASLPD